MEEKTVIEKPNYTQTPNILFDKIMCTLNESELKVFLAIIRKTFGWQKTHDRISFTQIEEMTGLSRQSISNGLYGQDKASGLVGRKLVIVYETKLGNEYLVNLLDYQEEASQDTLLGVVKQVDCTSQASRLALVKQVDLQKKLSKETNTKENERKNFSSNRIENVIQKWNNLSKQYPYRFTTTLAINGEDNRKMLKCLSVFDDELIFKAIENYHKILADKNAYKAFPEYLSFVGFLSGGVEKYIDQAEPFERCKIKTASAKKEQRITYAEQKPETQTEKAIRYKPELEKLLTNLEIDPHDFIDESDCWDYYLGNAEKVIDSMRSMSAANEAREYIKSIRKNACIS